MQLLAKSMDLNALDSIMTDVENFLNCVPLDPIVNLSDYELHCAAGHSGKELSHAMGIPYPNKCDICEQGNRIKASTSSGSQNVVTQFGDTVSVDFKISHQPDVDGYTVLMGATCEAQNWQELFQMEKRSENIR